ncbi:hypothetical protein BXZ70DRAFT_582249 [Cristinia sonorae]|uniref:ZZ-type domain-containing protein n=1 Tax=Cristinia sonorae TaxID=1940300 RepID=A0A8K0UEU7_9AGAR|nr:hypothetical protein BXZ70DRAFT_582249 [Cristinia sonorae]
MRTFHFNPDSPEKPTFSSKPASHKFAKQLDLEVFGICGKDQGGRITIDFKVQHERYSGTEYFSGYIDELESLVGYVGWSRDVSEAKHHSKFILRRISPDVMRFRPSPAELKRSKYRALWSFAIRYTLSDLRRKSWSWKHFKERRDIRNRFLKFLIAAWFDGRQLTGTELSEFMDCRRRLTPQEDVFYLSMRDYALNNIPEHYGYTCDNCRDPIAGSRLLCLDCPTPEQRFGDTIDVCSLKCFDTHITWVNQKAHHPYHDVLKLRTVVTYYDLPHFYQRGCETLQNARARFAANSGPLSLEASEDLDDEISVPDDDQEVNAIVAQSLVTPEPIAVSGREEMRTEIRCGVCRNAVQMPCWSCTQCPDYFLCDNCEDKSLLSCLSCDQQYDQPTWYY